MNGEVVRRAEALVAHIKSMHSVILIADDLRESTPLPAGLHELEEAARNRLRDILEAVDNLPYAPPQISFRPPPGDREEPLPVS